MPNGKTDRVPTPYDLVTFVTDYGPTGGFVGMLHAVVDSIAGPSIRILDLDHSIPPQDVVLGALRLARSMDHCRPGIHVAVIDPGVGGPRRALGLEAGGRLLIGPDNGLLLSAAGALGGIERVVSLERHLPERRSRTFDGRDVFAPAAGHLAAGLDLSELGPALEPDELVPLELPEPSARADGSFELTVLQVDGFGNVQFAFEHPPLAQLDGRVDLVRLDETGSLAAVAVGRTFSDVAPGEALVLEDSDACLALSVNRGRADELLGLVPGDRVLLRPLL